MTSTEFPRIATRDELEELRHCLLQYQHISDPVQLNLDNDWEEEGKPLTSIVFACPSEGVSKEDTNYQKLMIGYWGEQAYMIFGWQNGELKPLPPEIEHFERYL